MPRKTVDERFWQFVDKGEPNECWNWTGVKNKSGYGRFSIAGTKTQAHRYSWKLHNGPIPAGLWVLHKCDNPACVNPAHLFLGTRMDNIADMYAKGRQNRPTGDRHGTHTHPESLTRGDKHWTHLHPERRPFGEKNGKYTHPETRAHNYGSKNGMAKLTSEQVSEIKQKYKEGTKQTRIAEQYGISFQHVSRIVNGLIRKQG